MSSVKWQPVCSGVDELSDIGACHIESQLCPPMIPYMYSKTGMTNNKEHIITVTS